MLQAKFHLTLRIGQVPVESTHFVKLLERPDSDKSDNAERGERIMLNNTLDGNNIFGSKYYRR